MAPAPRPAASSAPAPGFRRREACELCGATSSRTLIDRPLTDPAIVDFLERYYGGRLPPGIVGRGRYRVERCRGCGFLWQAEVLDEVGLGRLYEEWIDAGESLRVKDEALTGLAAGYARQVELLLRLLAMPAHRVRLLDFGMGWGHFCRMARAYGADAVGLETSARRREHAAALGVPTLGSLDEIEDGTLDALNAEQVLEHVPDPLAVLRRAVRVLRPGAVARISVPNAALAARRLRRPGWAPRKDALQPLEHVNGFTPRTLRRMAAEAGLERLPQPFLPGQGLLGKSHRPGPAAWVKSLLGVPYRTLFGTTIWFRRGA